MIDYEHQNLNIHITEEGIKPVNIDKFRGGILNSNNFKIYILKDKYSYVYVGKTKQGIGTKFRQGFRSYENALNGKPISGYGGYQWIKKYKPTHNILQLYVFDLGDWCTDRESEAIEAEIVFQIRKNQKLWPKCQNEIHFNNDFGDAERKATQILNKVESSCCNNTKNKIS